MQGLVAFGAYVPRLRLQRAAAVQANAWFNPALKAQAKGERAIANWDEDAITMAVEAARDCIGAHDRARIGQAILASTTLPFQDRQNVGVVAQALSLRRDIGTLDIAGSQRAGTSALIQALRGSGETLIVASERRRTKAASPQELGYGDAAAAFLVGSENVVAKLVVAHSEAVDFVDHFRGHGPQSDYDYGWEERWIRDEGYNKLLPPAVSAALKRADLTGADIAHLCVPVAMRGVAPGLAKRLGIAEERVRDVLAANLGDAGTAHPLVMLADALAAAKPGERILVIGFGQGVDVLVFETTPALAKLPARLGVQGWLKRRKAETNYQRYLTWNDLVTIERGMRAEGGALPPTLSSGYRNMEMLLGLMGGKCRICGTVQWPQSNVCVNPNCNAFHSQDDHPFAEKLGKIMSYTADQLTYSPDPPACYGMVVFDEGGRFMADFTDVDSESLAVGARMRMTFRVKEFDSQRGYTRYFWKAAPAA
ncbi:MAG: 3-hydroxy-3-methylglutaryl CoA synthase [Alphaproteobacteria bacterium]|nr:3-hydroxy-3-methylglutaryl CoA synthase [Alphaproteobacteria bacterium]